MSSVLGLHHVTAIANGAHMAASLRLRRPGLLRGAVLLSPMVPSEHETRPDVTGTSVVIGAGRADTMMSPRQAERLAELLREAGADVTLYRQPGGHATTREAVGAAREWIAQCLLAAGKGAAS